MKRPTGYDVVLFLVGPCALIGAALLALWVCRYSVAQYIADEVLNHATVDISREVPARAAFNEKVRTTIDTVFATEVAINSVLDAPIDKTVTVPIAASIAVPLKATLHVNADVPVRTTVPIDTVVNIKLPSEVGGMSVPIPIQTDIPLDFTFKIRQLAVQVDQVIQVPVDETFSVHVKDVFRVPVIAKVQAEVPIRKAIEIPVKGDINTTVQIDNSIAIKRLRLAQ